MCVIQDGDALFPLRGWSRILARWMGSGGGGGQWAGAYGIGQEAPLGALEEVAGGVDQRGGPALGEFSTWGRFRRSSCPEVETGGGGARSSPCGQRSTAFEPLQGGHGSSEPSPFRREF